MVSHVLKTIIGEKESMESIGLDEEYIVDFAIDLYGRSLVLKW
jgi:hypothetical protein